MDIADNFVSIGNINVEVFKSGTDYRFYLQASNEDVSCVTDVIEDTLKMF